MGEPRKRWKVKFEWHGDPMVDTRKTKRGAMQHAADIREHEQATNVRVVRVNVKRVRYRARAEAAEKRVATEKANAEAWEKEARHHIERANAAETERDTATDKQAALEMRIDELEAPVMCAHAKRTVTCPTCCMSMRVELRRARERIAELEAQRNEARGAVAWLRNQRPGMTATDACSGDWERCWCDDCELRRRLKKLGAPFTNYEVFASEVKP